MKKLNLHPKFGWKEITILLVGVLILVASLSYATLKAVNAWYDTHTITFNKVVNLEFKKPIEIKERKIEPKEIIQVINEVPEYEGLNDIEKYICDKWGMFRCATVIAIFKSESGLREDALNTYNSNNTVDYGIAQINSIWWNKDGCRLKEIVEWKGNIDCAYMIWDRADGKEGNGEGNFSPWSAFNSGAFKDKLNDNN